MLGKIRNYYKYRIFPRVKGYRGSTRLMQVLDRACLSGLEEYNGVPQTPFSKEWDVLVVLDACRIDQYQRVVSDNVDKRISLGCKTPEFIEENFSSGQYDETVYVTGNPHFNEQHFKRLTGRTPDEVFHEVYHTYSTDWNDSANTVLPRPVMRDGLNAQKLFDDKRIVMHFMQPHYPFVKSNLTSRGIRSDLDHDREGESVWNKAERGIYSREQVKEGYDNNLLYFAQFLDEISSEFNGKIVVTADHGNLVGENRLYGHNFSGSDSKHLREVPWHVISDG